ncbi:MAG: serine hydrolase, partial [Firmicutes bacterium]|nr:serine hydrolase [Bacillota bacterium]
MRMTGSRALSKAEGIGRMLDRLDAQDVCIHGFTLVQDGNRLASGAWAPLRATDPHRMFSVSKSMTSLAIGLLEAEGRLRLTDAICDYFPDKLPDAVPGPLRRQTIRDMLRMASCHRFTTYKQSGDPDWTRTFFTVPPTHEPGTVFHYDTSASHTLAALAERLTGMPILSFLQAWLFDGIGATDAKRWLQDPVGVSQGGTGLIMTLDDLTKTAQFCLGGGVGTPLEGYLREAVKKQIDTPPKGKAEERYGYGYQFWRVRSNGYAMYGLGGQLAVCLPDSGIVFCTT